MYGVLCIVRCDPHSVFSMEVSKFGPHLLRDLFILMLLTLPHRRCEVSRRCERRARILAILGGYFRLPPRVAAQPRLGGAICQTYRSLIIITRRSHQPSTYIIWSPMLHIVLVHEPGSEMRREIIGRVPGLKSRQICSSRSTCISILVILLGRG